MRDLERDNRRLVAEKADPDRGGLIKSFSLLFLFRRLERQVRDLERDNRRLVAEKADPDRD